MRAVGIAAERSPDGYRFRQLPDAAATGTVDAYLGVTFSPGTQEAFARGQFAPPIDSRQQPGIHGRFEP